MEKYIEIIEDLICEFHQSSEKERYEQAEALEILLSLLGEIDDKEASDALHMLLHCALTNKDFETQKQQFEIVNTYIKQLEEENNQLEAIKDEAIRRYNFESIPISKVKGKIEELENQRDKVKIFKNIDEYDRCVGKIEALQELLREE